MLVLVAYFCGELLRFSAFVFMDILLLGTITVVGLFLTKIVVVKCCLLCTFRWCFVGDYNGLSR